jgi:hypothetical protein
MGKRKAMLTESSLKKIISEAVNETVKKYKTSQFTSKKPQYDINGKRWQKNFDDGVDDGNWWEWDKEYQESERAAQEFLNRPNAAQDFEHFPRYSRSDGGVKNYDSLQNGTSKIRALKRRRKEEKEAQENIEYMKRIQFLCRKAIFHSLSDSETEELLGYLDYMERANLEEKYESIYGYWNDYENHPSFAKFVALRIGPSIAEELKNC